MRKWVRFLSTLIVLCLLKEAVFSAAMPLHTPAFSTGVPSNRDVRTQTLTLVLAIGLFQPMGFWKNHPPYIPATGSIRSYTRRRHLSKTAWHALRRAARKQGIPWRKSTILIISTLLNMEDSYVYPSLIAEVCGLSRPTVNKSRWKELLLLLNPLLIARRQDPYFTDLREGSRYLLQNSKVIPSMKEVAAFLGHGTIPATLQRYYNFNQDRAAEFQRRGIEPTKKRSKVIPVAPKISPARRKASKPILPIPKKQHIELPFLIPQDWVKQFTVEMPRLRTCFDFLSWINRKYSSDPEFLAVKRVLFTKGDFNPDIILLVNSKPVGENYFIQQSDVLMIAARSPAAEMTDAPRVSLAQETGAISIHLVFILAPLVMLLALSRDAVLPLALAASLYWPMTRSKALLQAA